MKQVGIYDVNMELPKTTYKVMQISERYEYENNRKTDKQIGWNAVLMCPELENALLNVKADKIAKAEGIKLSDMPSASLTGVEIKPYVQNGRVALSVSAEKLIISGEK